MTSSGSLTGDEVRQTVFGKPPLGKRGYDPDEVDKFMKWVADALDGFGSLTADQVHNVVFRKPPIGNRGYDEEEVDALLDIVDSILRRRGGAGTASSPSADAQDAEPLSGYQIRQTVFPTAPIGGYDKKQVDEFMARVADTLDGSGVPLSADQVRGIGFDRVKGLRRGYHLDQVDAMIARAAAELRRRSAGW